MSNSAPLIFILVALAAFWLIALRPARNQQKRVQQLQSSLEVGQEVVLSAGIFGTIRSLSESRVELEIAPGTVITVARQVVVRQAEQVTDTPAEDPSDTPTEPEPPTRGDEQ